MNLPHTLTTEVWISTRGKIPEITRTAIQEALEADITKDTPSVGSEDLEDDDDCFCYYKK